MAEHRIALVQFRRTLFQRGRIEPAGFGHGRNILIGVREEFMQRRIEQADRARTRPHDLEDRLEIGALERQQLVERAAAAGLVGSQDHRPHHGDALGVEEHVLGAAQADPLGAEVAGGLDIDRRVGIGPHLQVAHLVGPFHERGEISRQVGLGHLHLAGQDLSICAIDGDDVALPDLSPGNAEHTGCGIDLQRPGTADAGPAHAAGDDGGVRGHPPARGDNGLGGMHAVDVLGAGLDAHEDDIGPLLGETGGLVTVEHDFTDRCAGAGRQGGDEDVAHRILGNGRVQQLVELRGFEAQHRLLLADQAFGGHVHGEFQRRCSGAFAVASLQHVELAVLDGEFEVLHVTIMPLQRIGDIDKLAEHVRHGVLERRLLGRDRPGPGVRDRRRGADAGHHVLALGIDQVFAIEDVLAGRGVAGEGNAGGRGLAHIAEHHGLDGDGSAPFVRNVVELAIGDGAVVHPRAEDRPNGTPELVARVVRERPGELVDDGLLVLDDDLFPVLGGHVGVEDMVLAFLVIVENVLERVMLEAQHDVRIHLDEAAIAVIGEAVAGPFAQPLRGLLVEAEIEDGIHHPRHRGAGAGADRDEQRIGRVAEALAGNRLDLFEGGVDIGFEPVGIGAAEIVECGADIGGDGEAGRHRQAEFGHFGEIGTLATEQVAQRGVAIGAPASEGIHHLACDILRVGHVVRSLAV